MKDLLNTTNGQILIIFILLLGLGCSCVLYIWYRKIFKDIPEFEDDDDEEETIFDNDDI